MSTVCRAIPILLCLLVATWRSVGQVVNIDDFASTSYPLDEAQRNIEFGLASELYTALNRWLKSGSAFDGDTCDKIASALISTGSPSVEMWFLAARVAEMRGQDAKAMRLLQEIVKDYAREKTPDFQVPAGVSANMWLGRLARMSGQHEIAVNAFEQAARTLEGIPQVRFLAPACTMYVTVR